MSKQLVQKNKKTPIVEFSQLDQNNKTQFLEFLIKNNISFDNQSGKQNFTAKITLKNFKQTDTAKENIRNKQQTLKTKPNLAMKSHIKDVQNNHKLKRNSSNVSRNQRTPLREKDTNKLSRQKLSSSFLSKSIQKKEDKTKLMVNKQIKRTPQSRTPQKRRVRQQNLKNSTSFSKSNSKLNEKKSPSRPKPRQKTLQSVSSNKITPSQQSLSLQKQQKPNKKQQNHVCCIQKPHHYQSQNRLSLLTKYSSYFTQHLKSQSRPSAFQIKQRPICWPLIQLQKFLDQFFTDHFVKNTQQIQTKKLNETLKKKCNLNDQTQQKHSYIAEALNKFLHQKFNKVHKVVEYNLVNLLYSLGYHLNETKKTPHLGLIMFQAFLMAEYQFQDYLFFLFARNILKNQFKKVFVSQSMINHQLTSQKTTKQVNIHQLINKKQIDKFLKYIVGHKNSLLLQEYHRMIFDKVDGYEIQTGKFLRIIVDDYQAKRESAQISQRNQKINNCVQIPYQQQGSITNQFLSSESYQSLQTTFNKILQIKKPHHYEQTQQMQELTFGQDTKQLLELGQYCQELSNDQLKFWHQLNFQTDNQWVKKEFNQMVLQKLQAKTHQLIDLLANNTNNFYSIKHPNQSNYLNQHQIQKIKQKTLHKIQQLLLRKCIALFLTVISMNKVKWLKQLHIVNPTQDDIEDVQQIQLLFRKIKESPTAKDIADFCKMILTVRQITKELSKFFI